MTTLIIEIPDSDANEISNIVRARGGNVVELDSDDENLTPTELELLKRGGKTAGNHCQSINQPARSDLTG